MEQKDEAEKLKTMLGDAVEDVSFRSGVPVIQATPEELLNVARRLREDPSLLFDYPADLACYDTGSEFVLWYRLYSMERNQTAILRVTVGREDPRVPSLTSIWPGFNWHERECFDLYGIRFDGHPDGEDPAVLRILLPEDWEGHPFRKDYQPVFSGDPLHGPQERN